MAYLEKADYVTTVGIDHLDQILAQAANLSGLTSDQVRAKHEAVVQSKITVYLSTRYDMAAEFAKTPAGTRDPMIVSIYVTLVMCSLFGTISPRDIPELREKQCASAIEMLKEIRDGVMGLTNVSLLTTAIDTTVMASNAKFISHPYTDASLINPPQ